MNRGCGTIFLGAYREFYGNRMGKNTNCGKAWEKEKTHSFGSCGCKASPSLRNWTEPFGATENNVTEEVEPGLMLTTTALTTEEGGNSLLDSIENPVAVATTNRMCTQIVGTLYNEAGQSRNYTNGCIKQDLMAEGYIYLDQPNLRVGSDLQLDQTRTATNPAAQTTRAIPAKVAFYSPWNKTGTIRNANVSASATNPCGNSNYAYRADNSSPFDNSAIGDPYCWCDKSQAACDLNPAPAPQPKPSAAPLIALAALAFLATS